MVKRPSFYRGLSPQISSAAELCPASRLAPCHAPWTPARGGVAQRDAALLDLVRCRGEHGGKFDQSVVKFM